jgi:hypothetical protein
MTTKEDKIVKKHEKVDIDANSPNHEIRSFFINTAIQTIDYMSKKAYNGRIRNDEHEKIKINQLKLIINACNVGNRILKDRQLDDYEKDLEALKHGLMLNVDEDEDIIEISPETIQEIEDLDEKLASMKEGEA